MADVARQAGVARATVFNYFSSKRALVDAITEEVFAYYHAMLEAALADAHHSTPTLVRALFDQMGMGIQAYHGFYAGVFREIAKLQVGLEEGSGAERARSAALALLVALMARGQQRGELASEHRAEDLAAAFDALANGTITHWLYTDPSKPLRERMQAAAEIFLGPVARGDDEREGPLPDLIPPWARDLQQEPTG
jgi:AcrR family transcriptional regulator